MKQKAKVIVFLYFFDGTMQYFSTILLVTFCLSKKDPENQYTAWFSVNALIKLY